MLLFKNIAITVLWSIVAVKSVPVAVDPVLDARSNETYVDTRATGVFILPPLPYFVNRMRPLVQPGKSLFFSGPGDYEFKARLFAHQNGLKVLSDLTDPVMTEEAAAIGGPIEREYWHLVSAAYSEVTSGPAYILLPGDPTILGTTWFKGTIWDRIEWPILESSSDVTGVLRLNPSMMLQQAVNIKP